MSNDTQQTPQHTPGPWRFCDSDRNPQPFTYSGPGYYCNPYILGPNDEYIVGCDEYDVFGPLLPADERAANISLMIAAPDMLTALKECEKELAWAVEHKYAMTSWANQDGFCALMIARAAIAEATGKEAGR